MSLASRSADRTPRTPRRSPLAGWMTSTAVVVAAAALLTACSDVTAPVAAERTAERTALAPTGAPRLNVAAGEVTTRTFTYRASESLDESLGSGHRVTMPAGAVCDPSTSGYGTGTWDSACTPLRGELTFTARMWTDATGRPQVTFSPDVRFVPGKVVTLRLRDDQASVTAGSAILWCPSSGAACVNESATDASLTSYLDGSNRYVFRRLKHFSGYQIILGREGEEPPPEGTY